MNKKSNILYLIIGYAGVMLSLIILRLLLAAITSCPLLIRMPLLIITYIPLAFAPLILSLFAKDNPKDYGFSSKKIPLQIFWGIFFGVAMSLIFTLFPHLIGLGNWFSSGYMYFEWWQFTFEFFYMILGVGLTEEIIFRGFIFKRFKEIFTFNKDEKCSESISEICAIIFSSILFGFFHILSGNIFQVLFTAFLGVLFCLMRKVKNCTTLSLILTHGIYDALLVVWTSVLLS